MDIDLLKCVCGKSFLGEHHLRGHRIKCDEVQQDGYDIVSSDECSNWRKKALDGLTASDICNSVDYSSTTVKIHIRGECNHDHSVSSLSWNNTQREWQVDE